VSKKLTYEVGLFNIKVGLKQQSVTKIITMTIVNLVSLKLDLSMSFCPTDQPLAPASALEMDLSAQSTFKATLRDH